MARRNFKVLYVSGEVSPFVRFSALADFMASFPQAVEEEGFEARIMMPKYGTINDRKFRLHDVLRLSDIEVHLKEKTDLLHVKVTALPSSKIQTYFLYNEKYFKRNGLFTDMHSGNDTKVNTEKIIFFNVGVLETLQRLGWKPDIIHCHDWHASLIPLLLRTVYASNEFFKDIKTVLTIHNIYRQGILPFKIFQKLLPDEVSSALHRQNDEVNMLYTGVEHVDLLTTTSRQYADTILHAGEETYGLGRILEERKEALHGILNGIDTRQWNPSTDKLIKKRYSIERLDGKADNKKALQEEAGLFVDADRALVGVIAGFDEFQGADLLAKSLEKLVALDIQIVICGSGDKAYEKIFRDCAEQYPEQVSLQTEYTDAFMHLAIAGMDILLMPGRIESCGMMQLFAMSYGTVPVVYAGGGIIETIHELQDGVGSGFIFHEYTDDSLVGKISEAIAIYSDEERWPQLVHEAMSKDFSWKSSAEEYDQLYRQLLEP
ncbi:MAG: starch synthase [Chlorobiaceae bacterium]|nr:starch synthase [Chlorobiaceae bacterium]